ncbi:MAG: hypothetical protein AAGF33_00430 [Pseudomonadota bacterium]
MGDRTYCSLRWNGAISDATRAYLDDQANITDYSECLAEFDQVAFGELFEDLASMLKEDRVAYAWRWGNGYDFYSGVLFSSHSGALRSFATMGCEIVIPFNADADLIQGATIWSSWSERFALQ